MNIRIRKGLNLPLAGGPSEAIQDTPCPKRLALDVSPFEAVRFKLHVKPGDHVACGDALLEDKSCPARVFIAPASGKVVDVVRGLKRQIQQIIIECDQEFSNTPFEPFDVGSTSREDIVTKLLRAGLFAQIYKRPCARLANPEQKPEAIFVKALESAPFLPSPQIEINEHREAFAMGLATLSKLCDGTVYLMSDEPMDFPNCENHVCTGPHPIANPSVHIEKLHPIKKIDQVVWTVHAHDVIAMGLLAKSGMVHNRRIISLAGEGINVDQRSLVRVFDGHPLDELLNGKLIDVPMRLVSGDPLMGVKRGKDEFLGRDHYCVCAIPEPTKRSLMHFIGLGVKRYTSTKTYLSKALPSGDQSFSTSLHGEERAFVDSGYYQKVMPLKIPVMQLVKALIIEDYEAAIELGLLEVDAEDFALPTFVCPCKIPMVDIVKKGQREYAALYLS